MRRPSGDRDGGNENPTARRAAGRPRICGFRIRQAAAPRLHPHLRTTVPVVPDAPIGYFRLDLYGGKQGYLVNTRDLCEPAAKIQVDYTAQNGRTLSQSVKTKTACGKAQTKRKRRRR